MTLGELSDNLADRLRLLTRRRGAVARHQSLHAAIAWSYDLLTPEEQHLFALLSVFAGDFDLAAASAVAEVGELDGPVSELIRSLVDKSLVNAVRTPLGTRFSQLETLRQFAEDHLADASESAAVRDRHMCYFVAWATRADEGVKGVDESVWHHRVAAEWHNLRNALSWADEADHGDAACQLVSSVLWWAGTRGRTELADWAVLTLSLPSNADHRLRPVVAAAASALSMIRNDLTLGAELAALAFSEEHRLGDSSATVVPVLCAIAEGIQNGPAAAAAMRREGMRRAAAAGDQFMQLMAACMEAQDSTDIAMNTGDLEQIAALATSTKALATATERLGNPSLIALASALLGSLVAVVDHDAGVARLENALDVANTVDARIPADTASAHLARLYILEGRALDALALLEPGIEHYRRSGALGQAMWLTIEALGALQALGHPDVVATLLDRHDVAAGFQLRGWSIEQRRNELQEQLGQAEAERLFDHGATLSGSAAINLALNSIRTNLETIPWASDGSEPPVRTS